MTLSSSPQIKLGVRAAGCHQVWELLTDVGILEGLLHG